jgi:predicted DNA-binding WGR domain protein
MEAKLYFREGKSDKVYRAAVNGCAVTCCWGRRGAAGQTKDFTFATRFEAENYYHQKLEEKRAKGYTVDPDGSPFGMKPMHIGPNVGGPLLVPAAPPPVVPITPPSKLAPKPVQSVPASAPVRLIGAQTGRKFRFDD